MFIKKLEAILLLIFSFVGVHSLASDVDSVKIVFYHGPTYDDHHSFDLDNVASLLDHPKFIHNQTNLYMHGYNGSQEAYSMQVMVDSYLKINCINFLAIDWKLLAGGSYLSAQNNLHEIGPKIADSILKLFQAGLEKDSLSLVGHSLGGIGVGLIGREITKKTNGNILLHRITGLDPSNADESIVPPLARADAEFVDVIHTDAGKIGSPADRGHADFWPNGGKAIQPGCPAPGVNDKCSHRKAWAYWAESVAKADHLLFLARREKPQNDTRCEDEVLDSVDEFVQMGLNCPSSARGNYTLNVNSDFASVPGVGLNS